MSASLSLGCSGVRALAKGLFFNASCELVIEGEAEISVFFVDCKNVWFFFIYEPVC